MAASTPQELAPFVDVDEDLDTRPHSREFASRKKCDGGVPCASCLSRNTECVKDENDDGRRKLVVKRRLEILEKDRGLLDDLLRALRVAGPNQLNALISMIRADAGAQEIKAFLKDGFSNVGADDNHQNRHQQSYRRHRHMLGRIQDFVNPPLQVPARPWTTVTDDDDLVSHLMSLWFTWAHPWWHWVDEKEFIKAMQAGDTSSLICTPYLVNMILADACLLDTLANDGSEPNLELRQQFYNEGKKGLDDEEGHVSLAYVATLGVQWTYLNTNGQDQLGNMILYQQAMLVKSLAKWRAKLEKNPNVTPDRLHAVDQSLGRLEWTLYCLNLFVGLALEQVRIFERPSREIPVDDQDRRNPCNGHEEWRPYPVPHTPIEWHPNCHYLAYVSLAAVITADEALYEEQRQSDPQKMMYKFERLFRKVKSWPETIPACMKMHERAMPHIIALHALNSWVIVTMSKQTASLEGHTEKPSLLSTPESPEKERWKDICIAESIRISELLEMMRQKWGADHFPVIIIQPATIAAFALLEDLESRPDSQQAFYTLCIILRAASRRFRVCKGVLRLLEKTSKESNLTLPDGCGDLLAETTNAMQLDDVPTRVDDLGLDYLLEKWDDLDLDEAF
ncbi:hypothetical protein CLCR_08118 [Cladophialophora carrionii]|uniref:Zn(2)-C6 fungal-type domain-containing protein n=1 Tax=Cladophialophora carrionii TaxID=86049 RepID=A0A1C1CTW6_9EURO|nr:hypothetical protein CLCR_08118 [Cladophialophora carrionii]